MMNDDFWTSTATAADVLSRAVGKAIMNESEARCQPTCVGVFQQQQQQKPIVDFDIYKIIK